MSSQKLEDVEMRAEIDTAEENAEVNATGQHFMEFFSRQKKHKMGKSSSKNNFYSKQNSEFNLNKDERIELNSETTEKLLHEIMTSSDENENLDLGQQSDKSINVDKDYLHKEKGKRKKKGNRTNRKKENNEESKLNDVEEEEEEEVEAARSITPLNQNISHTDQNLEEHALHNEGGNTLHECYFNDVETKQIKALNSREQSGESVLIEGDAVTIHKQGNYTERYNNTYGVMSQDANMSDNENRWAKKRNSLEKKKVSKNDLNWTSNNVNRRHSMKRSPLTREKENIRSVRSLQTPDTISAEQRSILKEFGEEEENEIAKDEVEENEEEDEHEEEKEEEEEEEEDEDEDDEEDEDEDEDDDDDGEEEEEEFGEDEEEEEEEEEVENEEEEHEEKDKEWTQIKKQKSKKAKKKKYVKKEIKYIYKNYSPAPLPETEKTGFWFIDTINSALDKCYAINEKDYYLNNMDIVELYPNDETQYIHINEMLKIKWPNCLKWNQLIYYTHILNIYDIIFKNLHKEEIQTNVLMLQNKKKPHKSNEIPLPKFFHKNLKDRCALKSYEQLPELKLVEKRQKALFHSKETFFKDIWRSSAGKMEKNVSLFFDKFSDKIINMRNNKVVDSLKEGTRSVISNVNSVDMFGRLPNFITLFFENVFSCLKYNKDEDEEIGEETIIKDFPVGTIASNGEARLHYEQVETGIFHKPNVSNFVNVTKKKNNNVDCIDSKVLKSGFDNSKNNNNFYSNTTAQTHRDFSNKIPLHPVNSSTLLYNGMKTNSLPRRSGTFNSMDYLVSNKTQNNVFTSAKKKAKSRAYTFDELPKYARSYANSRSKISSSFHSLDNDNIDSDAKSVIDINVPHSNHNCPKQLSSNSSARRNLTENMSRTKNSLFLNFTERPVKSPINDNFYTVSSLSIEKEKWGSKTPFQNGMNTENQEFLECKSNITPNYA